jgi:hypothetical protein
MKFKIQLARTEYLAQEIEVEANNREEAQEKAWDKSGDWECVSAEEFVNHIVCIEGDEE